MSNVSINLCKGMSKNTLIISKTNAKIQQCKNSLLIWNEMLSRKGGRYCQRTLRSPQTQVKHWLHTPWVKYLTSSPFKSIPLFQHPRIVDPLLWNCSRRWWAPLKAPALAFVLFCFLLDKLERKNKINNVI